MAESSRKSIYNYYVAYFNFTTNMGLWVTDHKSDFLNGQMQMMHRPYFAKRPKSCGMNALALCLSRPDCLKRVTVRPHMTSSSQMQWACYRKWKVEWEAQTGICRWSTSTFETPVSVLPWTCWSEGKWLSRWTGRQSNPHKWLASRKIWSVEKLETLPAGTNSRTSHHWSPGGERLHV